MIGYALGWNIRIKKFVVCILLLAVCSMQASVSAFAAEEPMLYAKAAVLMDAESGRVLYGKEETCELPMASTTKIMTLILALEYGNLEDIVTVSPYAAKMPEVRLGVKAGEQYRLLDLLYSMMLESHNDSACVIAEHIGGSVEGFAKMMNAKAGELGLPHTYFITPNGLDAADEIGIHHTTAEELAQMMRYCVYISEQRDLFQQICQTRSYTFSDFGKQRQFTVYNKNALLDKMEGVLAGKTGFTGDAGYCYVAAVTVNGKQFIVALLACGWPHNKHYKWEDTKTLLAYGNETYEYRTIDLSGQPVEPLSVEKGRMQTLSCYASGTLTMLLAEFETVEFQVVMKDCVTAPVAAGERMGELKVWVSDLCVGSFPICAGQSVREKNFSDFMQFVFSEFFY